MEVLHMSLDGDAHLSPFDVVLMVASVGGLPALAQVLARIPSGFPASVVVVQHRSARNRDLLPAILARQSQLPVRLAEDGQSLRRGVVYVAPPCPQLKIAEGPRLVLAPVESSRFPTNSCLADPLFLSAANQFRERTIGVVLTGRLRDGTEGVCAIKSAGGIVLVQDPQGCEAPEQPRSAMGTGCVDFVLPIDKIADALVCLTMVPGGADFFRVPLASWVHLPPPPHGEHALVPVRPR